MKTVDGTFQILPQFFRQLFILRPFKNGRQSLFLYALATPKQIKYKRSAFVKEQAQIFNLSVL